MTAVNPGPASTGTANTQNAQTSGAITGTFNSLPAPVSVAAGTQAYTTDAGPVYSNGTAWILGYPYGLKKHPFMPKGMANVQQVMAAPPTVAISTTNPLAGAQVFSATNNSGNANFQFADLSSFGVTCAGNPFVSGTSAPDPFFVAWNYVSASTGTLGTYNGGNTVKIRVVFTSSVATPVLVMQVKGISTVIYTKVNDQYTSLTPISVPNNGAVNYLSLTFAAPGTFLVEFIANDVLNAFRFGGMWTATGDVLQPAQTRGPRIIVMGDSFTTSTGGGTAFGFVNVFSEYMGWDDVWSSGIGGTGLTAPGTTVVYQARVAQDIILFNPDEVIIQGFFNDGSSSNAAVQAALTTLIATIQTALPTCRVTVFGPCTTNGSGYQVGNNLPASTGVGGQRYALAAAVASFNSPTVRMIDPTSFTVPALPLVAQTILNPVTSGATTFTFGAGQNGMPGTTYQFPDGSRTFIISVAGAVATVDKIPAAWPAGTIITPAPNCYMTGNGHQGATTGVGNADNLVFTDGIHPSPLGHLMLGAILGQAYAANLNS